MNYDRADLINGLTNQQKATDSPSTFSTTQGVVKGEQTGRLDTNSQRMAGQEGERFLQMMNDPVEAERTNRWMEAFGLSNEGYEFNQAKMALAAPPMPAPQGEQA